ncbi:MAG: YitT family protein [Deltaproteobacteria bacterium]|jgi:uncharacterized membrane-anchored protein YitT (DUF2179 family)|nr:YitT family protein [Deltaproteobacteria bacterium]
MTSEKTQENVKPMARQLLFFIAGTAANVLALRLFFIDNQIAAGGFSGIATVLNYLAPISVGNLVFIMNCPLILLSVWIMGWRYAAKTIVAVATFTLSLNLAQAVPVVTHDRFAASVFGGIFYAIGAFSFLNAKASAGGSDLISRLLLRKFRNISLGKMFLMIDGFCVLFAVAVYGDLEAGVYAMTAIAVFSFSLDRIIGGFNVADVCYIITSRPPEEMGRDIMRELHVGVTRQEGLGMFSNTRRHILMVVVRPREIQRLKGIIKRHDPLAFMVVAWASEVLGGGFRFVSDQS